MFSGNGSNEKNTETTSHPSLTLFNIHRFNLVIYEVQIDMLYALKYEVIKETKTVEELDL